MSDLKSRVVLVTGGSRGIGKAVALALAEAGAAVAVNYRERGEDAEAVAEAIHKSGGRAAVFGADVSLRSAVQSMVHDVEDRLGPIDILVNNAGMAAVRGLEEITEEDFDRAIAVNLKSVFLCTQAVLPGMRSRHWGRIVNISSIGARIGSGTVSVANGAAKAGVEGLTRSYALRLAPEGVTVNAVAPGLIDTEMGKPLIEAGVASRIPIGRAGTGTEIAQTVLLLVGNGYMTGQTIAVNGGGSFPEAAPRLGRASVACGLRDSYTGTIGGALEHTKPRSIVAISDYGAHHSSGAGVTLTFTDSRRGCGRFPSHARFFVRRDICRIGADRRVARLDVVVR